MPAWLLRDQWADAAAEKETKEASEDAPEAAEGESQSEEPKTSPVR